MAVAENAKKNIDTIEEIVSSQEDAPGTNRIMRYLEHRNDIAVNLDFPPYWKLLFLVPVFFGNSAVNFVETCNIIANRMIIKVARMIINSDKL